MESMNNEQAINVNIANYTGEKPVEVIIRKGEAATPLETKAPLAVNFTGTLGSVVEWLEKRVSEINQKTAHVEVDRDANSITLILDENDPYKKTVISGTIAFTEEFKSIGINDDDKLWEPNKLGQYFRVHRSLFPDKSECATLVSKLTHFTAKTNTEIEKSKDPSGSRADIYRQTVESDLKKFTVVMGVIKGMDKLTIEVEFDHYIVDRLCVLQLVSPDCKGKVDEYTDHSIDEQIAKIKELAPEIAILEK